MHVWFSGHRHGSILLQVGRVRTAQATEGELVRAYAAMVGLAQLDGA